MTYHKGSFFMPAGMSDPALSKWLPLRHTLFMALCMAGLSGCATPPDSTAEAADEDVLEPYNRVAYQFNYTLDGLVLKPVTQIYRGVVPEEGRAMVSNVIDNLYSPVVFANSVMQGDPENSFATFWRFMLNSTFGLGGLNDFATEAGLKNRQTDFGMTLALCDVEAGPYFVIPIIGPSTVRDAAGRAVDTLINPLTYIEDKTSTTIWVATAIDARSRHAKLIDQVYDNSVDPYTTFRSAYLQKRASDIKRARKSREKALEHSGAN
jgi:phospholipid-binding lipoprotein MlaA